MIRFLVTDTSFKTIIASLRVIFWKTRPSEQEFFKILKERSMKVTGFKENWREIPSIIS
jgi:hypothetical protein